MRNKIYFYTVNPSYCDFLRQFDKCVPYNFDKKDTRPFVGVLIKINDSLYYAPLTSPKPKHLKMKNQLDFIKIKGGELGAINLNNMIPILQSELKEISFSSYSDDKYKSLLQNQWEWCNLNQDYIKAQSSKLHTVITNGTKNISLKKRCCNFTLLEQKCLDYQQNQKNNEIENSQLHDNLQGQIGEKNSNDYVMDCFSEEFEGIDFDM